MDTSSPHATRLREIHDERARLLKVLLQTDELAVGTVQRVKRRCYNPRCGKCAGGPSHEQVMFLFSDGTRRTSAFVRRADESRFEKAGANYRRFRDAVRALRHLHKEELELLGAMRDLRAIRPERREP